MNTEVKPIVWIATLQIFAVLLGHAAGILGKSWCEKVHEIDWAPHITLFYAYYGLWLLILPLTWFCIFIIRQGKTESPPNLFLWTLAGIILLTGIGITGALALLTTLPRLTY